ncbi:PH domain-containing protein [Streptomyces sp. NPDC001927]
MEPTSALPIPARTLYKPWQRVALIAAGSVFTLTGALVWPHDTSTFSRALYTLLALYGLRFAIRGGMAGVRIDAMGITQRGLGRTRTVEWCSIREVIPAHQGVGPARTGLPEVALTNGTRLPLQAIAAHSTSDAQADLDAITTAHAAHRATCQTCTA